MSVSACGMREEIVIENSSLVWERADSDVDNEKVVIPTGKHGLAHQGVTLNLH